MDIEEIKKITKAIAELTELFPNEPDVQILNIMMHKAWAEFLNVPVIHH